MRLIAVAAAILAAGCAVSAAEADPAHDPAPPMSEAAADVAPQESEPVQLATWDEQMRNELTVLAEFPKNNGWDILEIHREWVIAQSTPSPGEKTSPVAYTLTWRHGFAAPYDTEPSGMEYYCKHDTGGFGSAFEFKGQSLHDNGLAEIGFHFADDAEPFTADLLPTDLVGYYLPTGDEFDKNRIAAHAGSDLLVRPSLPDGSSAGPVRFSLDGAVAALERLGELCAPAA